MQRLRAVLCALVAGTVVLVPYQLLSAQGQSGNAAKGPTTTIANVPLPVTITNAPLPVSGQVTVSGTPTVAISGTPTVAITGTPTVKVSSTRVPYQFRLHGGWDGNGPVGDDITHTIPAGTTLEIEYLSCWANLPYQSDNPLILSLRMGTLGLVRLQVPQLGGYNRAYFVSQPVKAFMGLNSALSTGRTVTLAADVHDSGWGSVDCYVSGELY